MKTVELLTGMAKKEEEFIETAEIMKAEYERALHVQEVESKLADFLGTDFIDIFSISFELESSSI